MKDKLYYLGKYRKKFIEYNFRKKDIENVEKIKIIDREKYICNNKINYETFCNEISKKNINSDITII